MQNISRDNLIDQLYWMLGEIKRRPKEAYFAVPEFSVAEIDASWMKQIEESSRKRLIKLQKDEEKRRAKIKSKKDNI